jgi:hypothetical protein
LKLSNKLYGSEFLQPTDQSIATNEDMSEDMSEEESVHSDMKKAQSRNAKICVGKSVNSMSLSYPQ